MKKLLVGLVALVMLVASLFPSVVAAQGWEWDSCCTYEGCCWQMCCAEQTNWYKVSYFEKVPTDWHFHGMQCVAGAWTSQYVEAHNSEEAAEMLGLRAGHDCFVGCALGYNG